MLKVNNVKKKYDEFTLECSLQTPSGCITGLIGKNGAGKSTTFKAILGLISIDGGSVELFGRNIRDLSGKERQKIGVVLSDAGFSQYLTVQDIGCICDNLYESFDRSQFYAKCASFDLPLKQKIKEFSTGMKAKLKVLTAISHQASLLILDEPTVGLDVMARDELLDLLRDFMEEDENRSILISSHISSDLETLCDDFYMIDNGKILLHEETDALLGNYALLKVDQAKYERLDKQYIMKCRQMPYGYACLTNNKEFYLGRYPDLVMEKGNIDDLIVLMIGGKNI